MSVVKRRRQRLKNLKMGLYTSSNERSESEVATGWLTSLVKQNVPDMAKEDIIFLLKRLERSQALGSTLQNLMIKLKLEFGEELAAYHRQQEEAAKARAAAAAASKARHEKDRAKWSRDLLNAQARSDAWFVRWVKFRKFMDENAIRSFELVPQDLRSMYLDADRAGILVRPWFSRYRLSGELTNPHREEVAQIRRSLMNINYF